MIKNLTTNRIFAGLDICIKICLISSPLFFMAIKGWVNGIVFLTCILSVLGLIQFNFPLPKTFERSQKLAVKMIAISLSVGFLSILITQSIRQNLELKAFDAPLRMLLCIPIFLYLCHKPLNTLKTLPLALTASIAITFIYVQQHPEILQIWNGRFSTKSVDPNAFGTYITCITALLLFSINPSQLFTQKITLILTSIGLLIGIYLIAGSGTRGAWLSIPPLLLTWIIFNARRNLNLTIIISGLLLISTLISYALFPDLQSRVNSGFEEVYAWLFTTTKDTSAGIRFSMWKITLQLFLERPFSGYGDLGYQHLFSNPTLLSNYNQIVFDTMAKAGPHNEYLANLLRSGIWGIISVIATLFLPPYIFLKRKSADNSNLLGIALFICLAISGLSIEVFTLKYTSSFYGLLIAMIYSQNISNMRKSNS